MKLIGLTKGYSASVSDEDYDYLVQWKWRVHVTKTGITYAIRSERVGIFRSKNINMHRVVAERMGLDASGKDIDHIDHNGINNIRENLRPATRTENLRNRRADFDGLSKYKGVSWSERMNQWQVQIKYNEHKIHLGNSIDEKYAARMYDYAARKLFGEFASLNLPDTPLLEDSLLDSRIELKINGTRFPLMGRKKNKGASSSYKGVCWSNSHRKWQSKIGHDGQQTYLGYFVLEIDAARTYDKKSLELYGDLAVLNFPREDYE